MELRKGLALQFLIDIFQKNSRCQSWQHKNIVFMHVLNGGQIPKNVRINGVAIQLPFWIGNSEAELSNHLQPIYQTVFGALEPE